MMQPPRRFRDRRYSTTLWRSVRDQTLARDAMTCQACGRVGDTSSLVADHRIPPERGGDFYSTENTQTLCRSCNNSKGHSTMEEWRARSKKPELMFGRKGESLHLLPARGNGRPTTADAVKYIAWAMDLTGVGAEPADHHHGRWSVPTEVHTRQGIFRVCPADCTRAPVRWPVRSIH
jgi:5-methylcytosine-specific restriction endonuclease McrA